MAILSEAEREAQETQGRSGSHDARIRIVDDPKTGERKRTIHADADETIFLTPIDVGPADGLPLTLKGEGKYFLDGLGFEFDPAIRYHTVIAEDRAQFYCGFFTIRAILRDDAYGNVRECKSLDAYDRSCVTSDPGVFPITMHDHSQGYIYRLISDHPYYQKDPLTLKDDSRACISGSRNTVMEDRAVAAIFGRGRVVMHGRSKADLYDKVVAEMHGDALARVSDDVKAEAWDSAVVDGGASPTVLEPFIGSRMTRASTNRFHGRKPARLGNVRLHDTACIGSRFGVRPEFIGRSTAARVLGEAPAEGGAAPALER